MTCAAVAWGTAWVLALPPERGLALDQVLTARRMVEWRWEIMRVGCLSREGIEQTEGRYATVLPRLAAAERTWDPSPAGRVSAARRWYVLAREVELAQAGFADRELVRPTERLGRLDAGFELRQALAALPPGSPPPAVAATPRRRRPPAAGAPGAPSAGSDGGTAAGGRR